MYTLIAEGTSPGDYWEKKLLLDNEYALGRDETLELSVDWEPFLSRNHLTITVRKDNVFIRVSSSVSNPVYYQGEPGDKFKLENGEHFTIGSTKFRLASRNTEFAAPVNQPVEAVTFDSDDLNKVQYRDADTRIEILSHLPEVIWGTRTEEELLHRLANLMLGGVERAEAVAIVTADEEDEIQVLHWDRRRETEGVFRPSTRLIQDSLKNIQKSILHIWDKRDETSSNYTSVAEFDWAFCTPIKNKKSSPWGIYVAGKLGNPHKDSPALRADVKFTELVSEIIGAVQQIKNLERKQSGFRQFFAPTVLEALGDDLDTSMLEPRECDVTVLFCDLRGFSQKVEKSSENLIGILQRVSSALEVMTQNILKFKGVTGDFQGDATLGFWGWPISSPNSPLDACKAALQIRESFQNASAIPDHPLADFKMGIGIAHGRAVAGKIGTTDQVKVTVFGPVVNLASRLEGMTKKLRVPIVIDEKTRDEILPLIKDAEIRIRPLGNILPYGMEKPVFVSEILPPCQSESDLTDEHIKLYEKGVNHFLEGNWDEAYESFHQIPASDRAQDFLNLIIAQHNRIPPRDWDGIIRLDSK